MSHIYLCILWHMHQPFYKDLISGEYKMPWTRLHALKDYYGMVKVLEDFPEVHQTFNLVPSMMLQVEEYAQGRAVDPFLKVTLKPAEGLTATEQEFMLRNFVPVSPPPTVARFPRYLELCNAWRAADRNINRALRFFSVQAFRDLQVLSQLAWFDEECFEKDPEVKSLVARGRDYTHDDQALIGRKQLEILRKVLPVYRDFAARGQIEISTTPFYHPILPLLCDSDIAGVSHPYVPLPTRFRRPQDARTQLERARQYCTDRLGGAPAGLWPSEGSVSDEALTIAADIGFRWAATDNGVLSRTLGREAGIAETYRPYVWRQGGREMAMLFRDHYLSDLIGFVYSRMGAAEAAHDFLKRIRENCRGLLAGGRDAFVPIILDGENAWEFFQQNGRPFLRELYRGITADPSMSALTVSEALRKMEPQPLDHIFPGSWIGANFDIWIGAEEDNRAWEHLSRARNTFDRAAQSVSEDDRRLAFEELLISEGSDWCWWYGPEHESDFRAEFDALFRSHLANVYRALHLSPPEDLSRPILAVAAADVHSPPAGPVRPVIDGEATSYFEWLGAGVYRVDTRTGAMHGQKFLIQQLYYGSDGHNLFVRIDFEPNALAALSGVNARFTFRPGAADGALSSAALEFRNGQAAAGEMRWIKPDAPAPIEFAFRKTLEVRVALAALGLGAGQPLSMQLSLWKEGLPLDAIPQNGWLDISTAEPTDWVL
jgi:alpha-amylase/alpha-mannosidase (GH57 family)